MEGYQPLPRKQKPQKLVTFEINLQHLLLSALFYFQIVKDGQTYVPISSSYDSSCVAECDISPNIRYQDIEA